jgi:ankyrin repeat protein
MWCRDGASAEALINAGADIHATSQTGRTALMTACTLQMSDCDDKALEKIKVLLAHGANKDAQDADGQTAKDIAESNDFRAALSVLAPQQS